jgi:hypothetical protein
MPPPPSPTKQLARGAANMITAAISKLTQGQPASVATSAGVRAASASI